MAGLILDRFILVFVVNLTHDRKFVINNSHGRVALKVQEMNN